MFIVNGGAITWSTHNLQATILRRLHEHNSFARNTNYKFPQQFISILPNIAKPNISMYAIMLCATTFTTAEFYIPSKQRNSYEAFEHCKTFYTTPSSCIIFMYHKRRFFSEYAALQRVSHNQFLVSIKDFSYLKQSVYLVFSFFSFFKKPWECYTGKAF